MGKVIEVVYEDGVFKPLERVNLENKKKYKLIIGTGIERFFGLFKGKLSLEEERDAIIEERLKSSFLGMKRQKRYTRRSAQAHFIPLPT